jgi:hypothetical protein
VAIQNKKAVSVIAYGFCLKMPIYEVRKRDIICIVNDRL